MQTNIDFRNIKALALDMDGTTLKPDTSLGEHTINCIKSLTSRGVQTILCTGRAPEAAERFRAPLGATGPMVYYNGAEVVDMPTGKVLYTSMLESEVVEFCTDVSRKTGVYFHAFFPGPFFPDDPRNVLISERQSAETEMYRNHTGIQAEIGDLKEAAAKNPRGCIKCMFLGEPEQLELVRPKLTERFGSNIFVSRSLRTFLEILSSKASKGSALARVMEIRGLKPDEVIAFGDDENDIPMFSVAGFSAATANAKESVKKAASFVIGSNADEGLAEFIERNFLTTNLAK